LTSFNDFGLAEPILRALAEEKYETPTPIQAQTVPLALSGRDVIGIAQTGTGKTASFALPILNRLFTQRRRPEKKSTRVLVLSPTRELAGQIAESFRTYGRHIRPLDVALAIGGVPINRQIRSLNRGVDVLVATPGRLLDLVNGRALKLNQIEVLVLDEADRMLDMGFIHDIRKIVAMVPKERQTLFFSATMPGEITKLAGQMLRDPAKVSVTPQATTAERIAQRVILTEKASKTALLTEVLKAEPIDRVLVFTRTKHGADKVVRQLNKSGHAAEAIHGNKSQGQRERVLAAFRGGSLRTLIATDIAARGIDVDGVSHVINYDLPNIPESYVHRIGRTARAGAEGVAISFCDHEERAYLRDIEKLIRMAIPMTDRRTGKSHGQSHGQTAAQARTHAHAAAQHRNGKGGESAKNGHQQNRSKKKRRARYGEQAAQAGNGEHRHHGKRPHGGHTERAKEQPKALENVTFMQRPGARRQMAGQRAPR
jgi:ATP-dependent RNA helicase RhlE